MSNEDPPAPKRPAVPPPPPPSPKPGAGSASSKNKGRDAAKHRTQHGVAPPPLLEQIRQKKATPVPAVASPRKGGPRPAAPAPAAKPRGEGKPALASKPREESKPAAAAKPRTPNKTTMGFPSRKVKGLPSRKAKPRPAPRDDRPTATAGEMVVADQRDAEDGGTIAVDASGLRTPTAVLDAYADDALRAIAEYEQALVDESDPIRCGRLHYEIGRLFEAVLGDLDRASEHLDQALAQAPDFLPAVVCARRVRLRRGDAEGALPLFDREIEQCPQPELVAGLWFSKARVLHDRLGRIEPAREAFVAAAATVQGDPTLLRALEHSDRQRRRWSALSDDLGRLATAFAKTPRLHATVVAQRAWLHEVRLDDPDMAAELYESALSIDEAIAPEVLPVLRRLHEQRKRWRDLVVVLAREAEGARSPHARAVALYRIGRVQADHLGNQAEAIAALCRSNEAEPRTETLAALAERYEAVGDPASLATTLTELAELVTDEVEQLAILLRLGRLCHETLHDDEAAISALEAARGLAAADPTVLHLLAPLYQRAERFGPLVTLYREQAEASPDTATRALAHAQAARILERIGRTDDAIEQHCRALDLDPSRHSSMRALASLYARAQAHAELVGLYERFVERVDPPRAIALLLDIAALHAGPLGDPARAIEALRRVLTLDPQHLGALHRMQQVAEAADDSEVLLDALRREIAITRDVTQQVVLLHRVGEVYELALSTPGSAIEAYRKALALDGTHRATLASLSRMYTGEQRWGDLAQTYDQTLRTLTQASDDSAAAALLQRLGQLHEHCLRNPVRAIECYQRALKRDARAPEAVTGLERLLTARADYAALVALFEQQAKAAPNDAQRRRFRLAAGQLCEAQLDDPAKAAEHYEAAVALRPNDRLAIEALRRVRAQQGQWKQLAQEVEQQAERAPPVGQDHGQAVADRHYAAQLRGARLDDPTAAIADLRAILERAPDDLTALVEIEPLLREVDDHDALIEIYARQAEVFTDGGAKAAALHERARLLAEHRPERVEEQLAAYSTILAIRGDDYRALVALESLALEHGKTKALAGVDARLSRGATRAELRAAYLTRRAEAMEVGGNPEALAVYRDALRLDPPSRSALRGMTRMAELLRDYEALADAAERQAEHASTPQGAADAWVRAGTIKVDRLEDYAGAIEDFDRALAKWPDHESAATSLSATMQQLDRHRSLVERLRKAAGLATDPARVRALWLEVAELQAQRLDDNSAAQASLEHLLKQQPSCAPAMLALARLYVDDRRGDDAVALLSRCLATTPPPAMAHAAHCLLAEAHEAAGRADDAFTHYQAALEAAPKDPELLRRVAHLQLEQGHFAAAADTATRLLEQSHDRADRVEVLRWIAHARLGMGRLDDAIEAWAEAVAFLGPRSAAAKQLVEHAAAPEHWSRYVDALTRYLGERTKPGTARVALLSEIAQLQHERLHDDNAAVGTLVMALNESDGDPELRMRLAQRLAAARRPAEAAAHLQTLLQHDAARPDRWRLLATSLAEQSRTREYQLAVAGLEILGEADEAEQELMRSWRPHTRAIRAGALVPGAWPELQLGGDTQTAIANLLAAVCDGLGKLRPPDLSAWGVASRDKIPPRTEHPVRVLVDRLASIFGLEELDVYVHRHRSRGVGIENTSRPSLLLPIWLSELGESQQVFLISQGLAHICRGTYAVHLMPPPDLALTVVAAVRAVVPSYGQGAGPAGALDDRARLISRGVPRRKRKMHESTAQVCASVTPPQPHVLVHWLHQTAGRVAALVADDLRGTVDVIRRTDEIAVERGPELLRRSGVIDDLMRMWLGEPAMLVRRRIGLIGPGPGPGPGQ